MGTSGGAFRLAAVLAVAFIVFILARSVSELTVPDTVGPGSSNAGTGSSVEPSPSGSQVSSIDIGAYLEPVPRPAAALELTGPDGAPLSLGAMRGTTVLVFFGYTHCSDVCPATIGVVGQAIDASGDAARAVLVSVDPERDTIPWLAEFVRYMPPGFTAATGNDIEVRAAADAWGVRYARVEEGDSGAYSMSHTADVFVVDAAGLLRARLPFGTDVPTMTAVVRHVAATAVTPPPIPSPTATIAPTATPPPSAAPSAPASATFWPVLVSSAVWSGGDSPVILRLFGPDGRINDPELEIAIQLLSSDDTAVGPTMPALTVRSDGNAVVSYVAELDIPTPGLWTASVTGIDRAGTRWSGQMGIMARDQAGTPLLGEAAPDVRTPVAADFGGDVVWVTTDPLPDPRLSTTSTEDALAAGRPFVLVVDSYRFKVTRGCGTALFMSRGLLDRWAGVDFIHHEPFRYTVAGSEPVLDGTLADPVLTPAATAWGVGGPAWGTTSMPWLFIADGHGIVRAKYQGVVGTTDVEAILSMIAQER